MEIVLQVIGMVVEVALLAILLQMGLGEREDLSVMWVPDVGSMIATEQEAPQERMTGATEAGLDLMTDLIELGALRSTATRPLSSQDVHLV